MFAKVPAMHLDNTQRIKAELILIGVTVIWGATFVVTQSGLLFISPFLLIAARFSLAFGIFAALSGRHLFEISRVTLRRGVVLGIFLTISYLAQTAGLQYTSAARSGFITYLFAVLVPPLQYLIARRTVSLGNLLGLAVVVLGVLVFSAPGAGGLNQGDIMTLLCAVGLAFYVVLLDRYSLQSSAQDLAVLQFGTVAVLATVGTVVGEWLVGGTVLFIPSPALLWTVAYLGILGTAVALGLQTRYQHETSPVRATIIFGLEPVFAALAALLLAAQVPTGHELVGGGLILAGLLISELWQFRSSMPEIV
ncbi:MAG: DMT family transporter [Spirochaeta sp.]|nr:DMT family transporter [Spirochaeta sp.]